MKTTIPTAVLLALAAAQAAAGTVFEMSEDGAVAQTLSVQDGMLRVDVAPVASQPATTMIFAGNEMLILNDAERSYYRITPATLEELGEVLGRANEQMSAAMEQMEAQLENLPPEQREMMERMMRDRMPDLAAMTEQAAPTVRIEPGADADVGGYACTEYAVYTSETLTQELCAADYGSVPGADDVAAVLENMQGFFEQLRNAMPPALRNMQNNPFDTMSQIDGFPVRSRIYVNGSVRQDVVLTSAETRDLAASQFEVPAGYAEQSLMPQGNPFQ